jgi:sugar O-acyltransferase (sialic acid O-acetyltransferase NeuD family)
MSNKKLAILGASGHGKVVAEIAELNGYQVEFYDDVYPQKVALEHWAVKGNSADLLNNSQQYIGVAVGIGNNSIRKEKLLLFMAHNIACLTLIHPSSVISQYSSIGAGSVVMAGATVNAFTTIDEGVIINTNSVVEHDCVVRDFAHICPGASIAGGCTIESLAWVGIGSSVKQGVCIGEASILGAGSVVVKNISAGVTAFGNPAKVLQA